MKVQAVVKHFKLMHCIDIDKKIAKSVLEDSASSLTVLAFLSCETCGFVTHSELVYLEHRYNCRKRRK